MRWSRFAASPFSPLPNGRRGSWTPGRSVAAQQATVARSCVGRSRKGDSYAILAARSASRATNATTGPARSTSRATTTAAGVSKSAQSEIEIHSGWMCRNPGLSRRCRDRRVSRVHRTVTLSGPCRLTSWPDALYRTVRAMAACGIFVESERRRFNEDPPSSCAPTIRTPA